MKLKIYITIMACLLITVIGIIQNIPIFMLTLRLIITIAVFYLIGVLLEAYLKKKVFSYDNIDKEEPLTEGIENEEPDLNK